MSVHLKLILLWKRGKIKTYHSSGTITEKTIQWFRLPVNDPVSVQPKHYIYWNEKKCWNTEPNYITKTNHLTRTSLYNQYTENVKDWACRPLTFSQMQQSCPDETSYDNQTETFWSSDMLQFSLPSLLKS